MSFLGSKNSQAKLKEEDIPKICDLSERGVGQKRIAALFGVSRMCVRRVLRKECWGHVP